jgi:hypothetical protein
MKNPRSLERITSLMVNGLTMKAITFYKLIIVVIVGFLTRGHALACVSCDPDWDTGDYCSYSKGYYHDACDFFSNFFYNFPDGFTIGINDGAGNYHHAKWNNTTNGMNNLAGWLVSGGASGALTADTVDATSTSGGNLARQTAALTLNVSFNDSDILGGNRNYYTRFGDLKMCNIEEGTVIGGWTLTSTQASNLNGETIRQILIDANKALGGQGLPCYAGSFSNLNDLTDALNTSLDECEPTAFADYYLCGNDCPK